MDESLFLFQIPYDDENISTATSLAEQEVEKEILSVLTKKEYFITQKHLSYSFKKYKNINESGIKNECTDPWNVFYTLLPLTLHNYSSDLVLEIKQKCREYLMKRQLPNGGFSGFQYDNLNLVTMLGTLYGLLLLSDSSLFDAIDRKKLYDSILSLKQEDGSFAVSFGEESDIRSTFAALVICYYFKMLTPDITKNVLEFTHKCLNYDGGFSPVPHCESHGGYTYCGICILKILNKLDSIDLSKTIKWIAMRQMEFAGGFNGRTNKIVDSCYSWWIGAPARIICDYLKIDEFWNKKCLTQYLLKCAQNIAFGGFCDHPPSNCDPFHTCFSLCGLSVAGEREKYNLPIVDPLSGVPLILSEKMLNHYSKLEL